MQGFSLSIFEIFNGTAKRACQLICYCTRKRWISFDELMNEVEWDQNNYSFQGPCGDRITVPERSATPPA